MTQEEVLIKYDRMLWNLAMKISRKKSEWEDLVSEGRLALLKALEKFDSKRGFKFITLAYKYVLTAMTNYRVTSGGFIEVSKAFTYFISRIESKMNLEPDKSIDEIMDTLNIKRDLIKKYVKEHIILRSKRPVYLNQSLGTIGEGREREQIEEIDSGENLSKNAYRNIEAEEVRKALEVLTPKERRIIRGHFGIETDYTTLEKLSKELHITKQRVAQIKDNALLKVKRRLLNAAEFRKPFQADAGVFENRKGRRKAAA